MLPIQVPNFRPVSLSQNVVSENSTPYFGLADRRSSVYPKLVQAYGDVNTDITGRFFVMDGDNIYFCHPTLDGFFVDGFSYFAAFNEATGRAEKFSDIASENLKQEAVMLFIVRTSPNKFVTTRSYVRGPRFTMFAKAHAALSDLYSPSFVENNKWVNNYSPTLFAYYHQFTSVKTISKSTGRSYNAVTCKTTQTDHSIYEELKTFFNNPDNAQKFSNTVQNFYNTVNNVKEQIAANNDKGQLPAN